MYLTICCANFYLCLITFTCLVFNLFKKVKDFYFSFDFLLKNSNIIQTSKLFNSINNFAGWHCPPEYCKCLKNSACFCKHPSCSVVFAPFTKSYLFVGTCYFYLCLVLMSGLYIAIFRHVKKISSFNKPGNTSVE